MDTTTLKRLLRIGDELTKLCTWLNERREIGNDIAPDSACG